jgi:ABC-type transport system substrate-binding protein
VTTWVVGQAQPAFDPQGPPDPVRWELERLLSRGLVAEDSTGKVVPAAAESVEVSADGLVYRFALRRDLAFADGRACAAADFRRALELGVVRLDHGTYAWLMGAITGMDRARAGRPLPVLGIATPDAHTVVIRLARPDPGFLEKLSFPGACVPWQEEAGSGWRDGIGDYRLAGQAPARLTLALRAPRSGLPDTIRVRFVPAAARVRTLLRSGVVDVAWPLPPDLLDEPLPPEYRALSRPARPQRLLVLIQKADLPPSNRPAARYAFSHGVNRGDLIAALGPAGGNMDEWLPGGGSFDFPRHDPEEVRAWLERGHLGRSLHAVMAYSSDGPASRIARTMQAGWARHGLDVELRPLRQPAALSEWLRRGGEQLRLVEWQPALEWPAAVLAGLAEPVRGPGIGGARTGWMTREFDRWIAGAPMTAQDLQAAQQRIADERIALPLARLPWVWVQRSGAAGGFHPRFGPEIPAFAGRPAGAR